MNFDNFILEIDDFLSENQCEEIIQYFENMNKSGFVRQRDSHKAHEISDHSLFTNEQRVINLLSTQDVLSDFFKSFWDNLYANYVKKYSILENHDPHLMRQVKLQKSEIGQGYHVWHCEDSGRDVMNRIATYIVYLNDVYEGGETEFLYYPIRIAPKMGKAIIFPGGFTHAHRGNPPLSNEKYIATGWLEYL